MDGHALSILTFAIFDLDRSSRTQVHPRAIRCGSGHRLQCDPAVPCRRSPRTTGHLEERGWTSPFQQAPRTWHYYTEQGRSTYHQWVFLVGYLHTHYTCKYSIFMPKYPLFSQACGWRMRQYMCVRLKTTLAGSRPRPESLWLDWVSATISFACLILCLFLSVSPSNTEV